MQRTAPVPAAAAVRAGSDERQPFGGAVTFNYGTERIGSPLPELRSPGVEDLSRRLQASEVRIAAHELQGRSATSDDRLVEALEKQSEALTAALSATKKRSSTIKVEPKFTGQG